MYIFKSWHYKMTVAVWNTLAKAAYCLVRSTRYVVCNSVDVGGFLHVLMQVF